MRCLHHRSRKQGPSDGWWAGPPTQILTPPVASILLAIAVGLCPPAKAALFEPDGMLRPISGTLDTLGAAMILLPAGPQQTHATGERHGASSTAGLASFRPRLEAPARLETQPSDYGRGTPRYDTVPTAEACCASSATILSQRKGP